MEDEVALVESEALDRIKASWVLRPAPPQKKRRLAPISLWVFLGLGIAVVLTATLAKTLPRHRQQQPPDEYLGALQKALLFFNAQRAGRLPEQNGIPWRGDSCLQDGNLPGSSRRHLAGGYYDGGDSIKRNFPMSFSMTLLSWSVIEYSSKYRAAGELSHVQGVIRWGTDYFLETFDSNADRVSEMVWQVGSGGNLGPNDNYCWMRPEDIDYRRPVAICFSDCPQLAAEMAAALASASIVLKDDEEYSQKLIRSAKVLYKFAESMTTAGSTSGMYWDELIWGGAWLYYATGDLAILERVTSPALADRALLAGSSNEGVFGWDTKLAGAQLLLTRLTLFISPGYPYEETLGNFHSQIGVVMCSYLPFFNKFNRTKGGLILLNHGDPQALQYAANAAFLAVLYSDYLDAADAPGWYCGPSFYSTAVLREFARSQIDYILGKNPQNMSYVVGFGERYSTHVHHRGASIPNNQRSLKWLMSYECESLALFKVLYE